MWHSEICNGSGFFLLMDRILTVDKRGQDRCRVAIVSTKPIRTLQGSLWDRQIDCMAGMKKDNVEDEYGSTKGVFKDEYDEDNNHELDKPFVFKEGGFRHPRGEPYQLSNGSTKPFLIFSQNHPPTCPHLIANFFIQKSKRTLILIITNMFPV